MYTSVLGKVLAKNVLYYNQDLKSVEILLIRSKHNQIYVALHESQYLL